MMRVGDLKKKVKENEGGDEILRIYEEKRKDEGKMKDGFWRRNENKRIEIEWRNKIGEIEVDIEKMRFEKRKIRIKKELMKIREKIEIGDEIEIRKISEIGG